MSASIKKKECPVDWAPLVETRVARPGLDVKVDQCPKCQGVFLDKNEIGRLTGNHRLNDYLTKFVGLDSDSQRVCPSCGMVMDMEDCEGVRIDVCLSCFGVWLDAGELESLKTQSPDEYKTFSSEKMAELEHAKAVRAKDHKRALKMFFYRLAGLDLIKRRRV